MSQNNTLHLNLKKKWFNMFLNGTKNEEYREINDYWSGRLLNNNKQFKTFKTITFSNGYSKTRPQIIIELKEIKISTGKPKMGAFPEHLYFVLKTGTILATKNFENYNI